MNALFSGLLCLNAVLRDPFGNECCDFPALAFHGRLYKSQVFSREMLFPDATVDEDLSSKLMRVAGSRSKSKNMRNFCNDDPEEEAEGDCGEDEEDLDDA